MGTDEAGVVEGARVGDYGLTVDDPARPRAVALVAYQDAAHRRGEPYTVIDWLPYSGDARHLWEELIGRGVPAPEASQLVVGLAAQVARR